MRPGLFDAAEVAGELREPRRSGIRAHRLARRIEIEAAHFVQWQPGNQVKRGRRGFQPPVLELGQSDLLGECQIGEVFNA